MKECQGGEFWGLPVSSRRKGFARLIVLQVFTDPTEEGNLTHDTINISRGYQQLMYFPFIDILTLLVQ
jgi:hypothetical protein